MKKRTVLCIALVLLTALSITACTGAGDESSQAGSDPSSGQQTVYAAQETVRTSVAKFNTQVLDSGLEYPAQDDYLTIEGGT